MFFRQESQPARRLVALGLLLIAWGVVLLAKLFRMQVLEHDFYREKARRQQTATVKMLEGRAPIYDRNGAMLAGTVYSNRVVLNPRQITDPDVVCGILSPLLSLDRRELERRIKLYRNDEKRSGYLIVKRNISRDEYERLLHLRQTATFFSLERETYRVYPKGEAGLHVVGTVDDGHGVVGVEKTFDKELIGEPARMFELKDVRGEVFLRRLACQDCGGKPGRALRLTIDERLQLVAQEALARAVATSNSTTGSVVVMDAFSGEVLAMASYPEFDRTRPPRNSQELQWRLNNAISAPFEPGSVFKCFTFAALIDTQGLNPQEVINCGGGRIQVAGQTIKDHHPYGALTAEDVLAKSSNVGTIRLGLRLDESTFRRYIERFGFGQTTGITLPAESKGKVRGRWMPHSIAYISMGHEISTTTLQLAVGIAAFANGGYRVRPTVLADQLPDRKQFPRVIKPETAAEMRRLMRRVVESGTGRAAKIPGYSSAGKTGSAQIYDFHARRYTNRYNASFAGFSPVDQPRFVAVVTINGSPKFGGAVAAPVFAEVMRETLRLMEVPPDLPLEIKPRAPAEEVADLASPPAQPPAELDLEPPAQAQASGSAEEVIHYLGPVAPNLVGLSLRKVITTATAQGLEVEVKGKGIARAQYPAAGSPLKPRQRVRVEFEP